MSKLNNTRKDSSVVDTALKQLEKARQNYLKPGFNVAPCTEMGPMGKPIRVVENDRILSFLMLDRGDFPYRALSDRDFLIWCKNLNHGLCTRFYAIRMICDPSKKVRECLCRSIAPDSSYSEICKIRTNLQEYYYEYLRHWANEVDVPIEDLIDVLSAGSFDHCFLWWERLDQVAQKHDLATGQHWLKYKVEKKCPGLTIDDNGIIVSVNKENQ